VLQWGLDKRACAKFAQEFGFATILGLFRRFIGARGPADRMRVLESTTGFGIWQGLTRVVGAFGDCPRCLAVCPVGDDYNRFLREDQRVIPEKTAEKVGRVQQMMFIRKTGAFIAGMAEGRIRWIGEDGYAPPRRHPREPPGS
jgi:hypothetical protein